MKGFAAWEYIVSLPPSLPLLPSSDCGSGIGRITKRLLLPLFSSVDMVEQNETFLQKSATYLGPAGDRVERKIAQGLQVCPILLPINYFLV